jgi:RNA polymerase sigma-70 factor, ECF subfamily
MTVWRRLDDVPTDDPLPWIYGVARRVLANQFRTTRRRGALFSRLAVEPATGASSTDPAELVGERELLAQAFGQLREEDREVLALVSWEGLDPQRGAKVLGITSEAFTARVYRARRRLRVALEEAEPPAGEVEREAEP